MKQKEPWPEGCRLFFWSPPLDINAVRLPIPFRKTWPMGLGFGAFFLITAWIARNQYFAIQGFQLDDFIEKIFFCFGLFFLIGWLVGVFILGLATVLLFLYGQSWHIQDGSLYWACHLGPLRIQTEYALEKVKNLRTQKALDADEKSVRLWFDYGDGKTHVGDEMDPSRAQEIKVMIERAPRASSVKDPNQKEAFSLNLLPIAAKFRK